MQRMRDGFRRVCQVSEVIGMEGEVVVTQDLFTYEYEGENPDGTLRGTHKGHGVRPRFSHRASYYGLEDTLLEAMACKRSNS
jgi:pilus assembly protein CpaF